MKITKTLPCRTLDDKLPGSMQLTVRSETPPLVLSRPTSVGVGRDAVGRCYYCGPDPEFKAIHTGEEVKRSNKLDRITPTACGTADACPTDYCTFTGNAEKLTDGSEDHLGYNRERRSRYKSLPKNSLPYIRQIFASIHDQTVTLPVSGADPFPWFGGFAFSDGRFGGVWLLSAVLLQAVVSQEEGELTTTTSYTLALVCLNLKDLAGLSEGIIHAGLCRRSWFSGPAVVPAAHIYHV
ncbi:hypothetical protein Bbelb_131920 [Branchiostoma belcheri]|nr:hypothetical protein Bbelb_131920 [Branchiostoma belcheri]